MAKNCFPFPALIFPWSPHFFPVFPLQQLGIPRGRPPLPLPFWVLPRKEPPTKGKEGMVTASQYQCTQWQGIYRHNGFYHMMYGKKKIGTFGAQLPSQNFRLCVQPGCNISFPFCCTQQYGITIFPREGGCQSWRESVSQKLKLLYLPSFGCVYHVRIPIFKSVYRMCVPPFSHSAVRFLRFFWTSLQAKDPLSHNCTSW